MKTKILGPKSGVENFETFSAYLLLTPLICPGNSPPVSFLQAGPPKSNHPLVHAPHLSRIVLKYITLMINTTSSRQYQSSVSPPVHYVDSDCVSPAKYKKLNIKEDLACSNIYIWKLWSCPTSSLQYILSMKAEHRLVPNQVTSSCRLDTSTKVEH